MKRQLWHRYHSLSHFWCDFFLLPTELGGDNGLVTPWLCSLRGHVPGCRGAGHRGVMGTQHIPSAAGRVQAGRGALDASSTAPMPCQCGAPCPSLPQQPLGQELGDAQERLAELEQGEPRPATVPPPCPGTGRWPQTLAGAGGDGIRGVMWVQSWVLTPVLGGLAGLSVGVAAGRVTGENPHPAPSAKWVPNPGPGRLPASRALLAELTALETECEVERTCRQRAEAYAAQVWAPPAPRCPAGAGGWRVQQNPGVGGSPSHSR